MLVTLARNPAAGLIHEFALCFEGRVSEELRACGAVVHLLGEARFRKPWTIWRSRQKMATLLALQEFDAVICHAAWTQAVFAPIAKRTRRLVYWEHDLATSKDWLRRLAARTEPDLVVANSRYTASTLPPTASPVEVIPCPVAVPDLPDAVAARSEVRREFSVSDQDVVVIQACRLAPWKGHEATLEALAAIDDVPNWVAWIAGGPQQPGEKAYFELLQRRAAELGVESRVRFLGQRSDVRRLLAAADVHCQPNSDAEPFGVAFIEALCAGLPVVTTAIGGVADIVDTTCGILVPPKEPMRLAEALRQLISNAELRKKLGMAGVRHARELCDPTVVQQRIHTQFARAIIQGRFGSSGIAGAARETELADGCRRS